MNSSSELSLPAIPEAPAASYISTPAHSSPRSTSDNPARNLQPISQHSRLLQPTLSWQAKAGYIPEPADALRTSEAASAQGVTAAQDFAAAGNARDQALAAGRRTSLVSTISSFKDKEADTKDASGESYLPNVHWIKKLLAELLQVKNVLCITAQCGLIAFDASSLAV